MISTHYARLDRYGNANQKLEEHLRGVANNVRKGFSKVLNFKYCDSNTLDQVVEYMGYLHDLGKYTDYFQDYLINGNESPYSDHAHISALYLYQILRQQLKVNSIRDGNNMVAFLAYSCARQHHGNLNLKKYCQASYYEAAAPTLNVQAENLSKKTPIIFNEDFSIARYMDAAFFKNCSMLRKNLPDFKMHVLYQYIVTRLADDEWYFLLIYMFSLLIDNDKIDSAGVLKKQVNLLPADAVEAFLKDKPQNEKEINQKRNTARQQVRNMLASLSDAQVIENRFYSLSAPTGLGKTLLSLECALELQNRVSALEGYTPRIISAIPFINIIEQTSKVYREVLGDEVHLILHHRLAEFGDRNSKQGENIPLDHLLLEMEAWEGDVILTTFVQFFHSILTGRNRALKKLNKLAGSIVILDEVQAIPEQYMPLLGSVLIKMARYYGMRFILMTATQPHLLQSGYRLLQENDSDNNYTELLPDNKRYFEDLTRTELIPMLGKNIDNNEFIELVLDKWNYTGSVLIVVNTIKRSIDLFKLFKDRVAGKIPEGNITYLSTNIIPDRRREVIDTSRRILGREDNSQESGSEKEPYILISTQTIEAGVDLDFDMAFRDLAPLEALVQTAGRVNRENAKGIYCPVYLVRFNRDSSNVYKLSDLHATADFISKHQSIKESEYQTLIEEYYQARSRRPLPDESERIWHEGIMKLDFDQVEEFELIQNTGEIVDVFVELDEHAEKIADAYEEIKSYNGPIQLDKLLNVIEAGYLPEDPGNITFQERKVLLRLIMTQMNRYIISIRQNRLSNNLPPRLTDRNGVKSTMLIIPRLQIEYYYDLETGYKDEMGGAYIY